MPTRLPTLLVAGLLATLFLVACGGSEKSLSKAEYIKQGDAICKETDKRQAKEYSARVEATGSGMTTEQIVKAIVLPSVLRESEELDALASPQGEEEKAAAFVAGIEDAVRKSEKAVAKDPESFEEPFAEVDERALKYGFHDCSDIV
jgi:hypothetical protein